MISHYFLFYLAQINSYDRILLIDNVFFQYFFKNDFSITALNMSCF